MSNFIERRKRPAYTNQQQYNEVVEEVAEALFHQYKSRSDVPVHVFELDATTIVNNLLARGYVIRAYEPA